MVQCVKCGSMEISGPSYFKDPMTGECLVYRCGRCGYASREPCKDSYCNYHDQYKRLDDSMAKEE